VSFGGGPSSVPDPSELVSFDVPGSEATLSRFPESEEAESSKDIVEPSSLSSTNSKAGSEESLPHAVENNRKKIKIKNLRRRGGIGFPQVSSSIRRWTHEVVSEIILACTFIR
jgi:hypothetical protein